MCLNVTFHACRCMSEAGKPALYTVAIANYLKYARDSTRIQLVPIVSTISQHSIKRLLDTIVTGFGDIRISGECSGYRTRTDRCGRLEFQLSDGTWGTVCGNSGFNDHAATVACKQLDYGAGNANVKK